MPLLLFIAAVVCATLHAEPTPRSLRVTPEAFESREAAEAYAKKLFAGGAVEMLRVGKQDVLVLYVHGSGVPDIAIAAFRFVDGAWRRAAEIGCSIGGVHRAIVRDGAIIVVSDRTSDERVLLSADETKG